MRTPQSVSLFDPPTDHEIKYLMETSIRNHVSDTSDDQQIIYVALNLATNFQLRADMIRREVDKFRDEVGAKKQGTLGLATPQQSKGISILRRIKLEL